LPTIGQTSTNSERKIFVVEAKSNPKAGPLSKGTVALIKEPYKLVYYFNLDKKREIYELYDIQNDPDEMEDLSAITKGMTAELKAELAGKLAEQNRVP
jgi:hypothetical protein